jgi:hypothetical protein
VDDTMMPSSWLNHWRIKEEVIMENTNDIKNTITTKFEENLWCHKELEDKRKLRYYKEMVNPNLERSKVSLSFESEKHFLLECLRCTQIRHKLGTLLLILFKH